MQIPHDASSVKQAVTACRNSMLRSLVLAAAVSTMQSEQVPSVIGTRYFDEERRCTFALDDSCADSMASCQPIFTGIRLTSTYSFIESHTLAMCRSVTFSVVAEDERSRVQTAAASSAGTR